MRIRTGIVSVEAHQFLYNKKFEGNVEVQQAVGGRMGGQLRLLPKGLEVLGASTYAVKNPANDKLIEVNGGDWILQAPSGNIIVVDDETFKTQYLDFLGAVEELAGMVSDPI